MDGVDGWVVATNLCSFSESESGWMVSVKRVEQKKENVMRIGRTEDFRLSFRNIAPPCKDKT